MVDYSKNFTKISESILPSDNEEGEAMTSQKEKGSIDKQIYNILNRIDKHYRTTRHITGTNIIQEISKTVETIMCQIISRVQAIFAVKSHWEALVKTGIQLVSVISLLRIFLIRKS